MGALASKIQVERVKENVDLLMKSQEKVFGNLDDFNVVDAQRKRVLFCTNII
jgi:oxepin-CoA hydrolase/3-oxo-5,6-dehydrosuberyl-CoA semialdehyde dehydrogenase